MPLGLPGRLSKGAGTHLASWLQEVSNVPEEEARSWLESPRHERTNEAVAALQHCHGKTVGHAGQILDAAFSGDLLVTKDATSLRLWRARCVVGDQRYCGFFHSIRFASVACSQSRTICSIDLRCVLSQRWLLAACFVGVRGRQRGLLALRPQYRDRHSQDGKNKNLGGCRR